MKVNCGSGVPFLIVCNFIFIRFLVYTLYISSIKKRDKLTQIPLVNQNIVTTTQYIIAIAMYNNIAMAPADVLCVLILRDLRLLLQN